jgi:pimeloyl-ACP methyl ester carboxylesterase
VSDDNQLPRRSFLGAAAASIVAAEISFLGKAYAKPRPSKRLQLLEPIKQIKTDVLDIGYYETGAMDGTPVLLLHGWPYDIHAYVDVAPILAARGCRVIVPHLRGHGTTRFLDSATPRSGQQAALGADVIALMDALKLPRALVAGYDWGARAACVAVALWPERFTGMVSSNYNIQDITKAAAVPSDPRIEAENWFHYYFLTERGRAGLAANRRDIAKMVWKRASPKWHFDDATFDRSARAFDNPDYVDVVIHSYRCRLGLAPGYPPYEELEKRLVAQPAITVPAILVHEDPGGARRAMGGASMAAKFVGGYQHRVVPNVGHNLPQEAPAAFAAAVWELASKKS